jgi:phosphoglycerate dehydrogenase-like enzyme
MFRVDGNIIAQTSARLIHQFGVGLEGVDIAAATQRGIYVANVPGTGTGNAFSVAEHSVFLMLALARQLPRAQENVQRRLLGSPLGTSLQGKTAGVVGVGSIGKELSKRLKGFGMKVLGLKRHPAEEIRKELGLEFLGGHKDLPFLLRESDFVILTLPVTTETRGLIGGKELADMRRTAFLINVGRGPLIDHQALVNALAQEQIAGAGLDVFWDEPTDPEDVLLRYNVIATPHVAGVTDLSYHDIARTLAENVNRVRAGLPPLHCVNIEEAEKVRRREKLETRL